MHEGYNLKSLFIQEGFSSGRSGHTIQENDFMAE